MDVENVVRELFHDALEELLIHYGGSEELELADSCGKTAYDLCAVIGLADRDFRATIGFDATRAGVRALMPAPQDDYADWLGELSNQLAGRFKNKIAELGLSPRLSTPAVIAGTELETLRTGSGIQASECIVAKYSEGEFLASLQLELDSELEIKRSEATEVASEGSLELF
ncbi:MAG: chemotaxis protein CheX [Planctomycetota bacterium]